MTAATITGTGAAASAPTRANVAETILYGVFDLAVDNASGALELNDVLKVVKVPKGFTVLETIMVATDLDTNGTPTITLELGDGGDTDRFISASTIAQAGGIARMTNIAGAQYTYTDDDTIDVRVSAAVATGATTGTIKVTVIGTMAQIAGA